MASTTSLTVTPAAFLTALIRSSDQDCAAHRRAPPIGTLSMVRGARNGRVSCCSSSAARPRVTVEEACLIADCIVPASFAQRPALWAGLVARGGTDHGAPDFVVVGVGGSASPAAG